MATAGEVEIKATVSPGWFDLGEPPGTFEVTWQAQDGDIRTEEVKAFSMADAAWRVAIKKAPNPDEEASQMLDVIRLS